MGEELITVLVPARNEERYIASCLDSVLAQDERNLQVLVVDGASEDATAEIVRGYASRDPRVELLDNPARSIPQALNVGLGAARGRWLVRVDAHSSVPPDYVRKAVERLRTGLWGGVGGRKDAVGVTAAGEAIAVALGSRWGVGNSVYHHGTRPQEVDHVPFGAYPTALLRRLGGWDERLEANEDYELDYRIRRSGHRLLFDPALRIEWVGRQSVPELFQQYRRYGRGKAWVTRLHPESLRVRHVLPPALVAALGAAALVGPRRPRASAAVLLPYVGALAAGTASTLRSASRPPSWSHLMGAFAAMHLGYGFGFWEAALRVALARGHYGKAAAVVGPVSEDAGAAAAAS